MPLLPQDEEYELELRAYQQKYEQLHAQYEERTQKLEAAARPRKKEKELLAQVGQELGMGYRGITSKAWPTTCIPPSDGLQKQLSRLLPAVPPHPHTHPCAHCPGHESCPVTRVRHVCVACVCGVVQVEEQRAMYTRRIRELEGKLKVRWVHRHRVRT